VDFFCLHLFDYPNDAMSVDYCDQICSTYGSTEAGTEAKMFCDTVWVRSVEYSF